jgi:toxin CptA
MSIAVSAVIMPSRLLRASLAAQCAACAGVGIFLAASPAGMFLFSGALAVCCCACAGAAMLAFLRAGKMRRIDISGLGKLRVTVQQNGGEADAKSAGADAGLATLQPGSTVWPRMMMLLLCDGKGAGSVVAVLPDSVSAEQFRALAVAIRTMGGQETRPQDFFAAPKIL